MRPASALKLVVFSILVAGPAAALTALPGQTLIFDFETPAASLAETFDLVGIEFTTSLTEGFSTTDAWTFEVFGSSEASITGPIIFRATPLGAGEPDEQFPCCLYSAGVGISPSFQDESGRIVISSLAGAIGFTDFRVFLANGSPRDPNTVFVGTTLTIIPEPRTGSLLTLGLIALGLCKGVPGRRQN